MGAFVDVASATRSRLPRCRVGCFCAAGAGTLVVVCRWRDRGQIYCPGGSAAQARRETLRRAGARYRRSGRGRQVNAAQMARWRAQRKEKVTHHGSPAPVAGDPVPGRTATVPCDDASPAEPLRCGDLSVAEHASTFRPFRAVSGAGRALGARPGHPVLHVADVAAAVGDLDTARRLPADPIGDLYDLPAVAFDAAQSGAARPGLMIPRPAARATGAGLG